MAPATLPPEPIRRAIEERLFGGTAAGWEPIGGGLSGDGHWRACSLGVAKAIRRWPADRDLSERDAVLAPALTSGLPFVPPLEVVLITDRHRWEATDWIDGEPLSEREFDDVCIAAVCKALAEFHRLGSIAVRDRAPRPSRVALDRLRGLETLGRSSVRRPVDGPFAKLLGAIAAKLPQAATACRASFTEPPVTVPVGIHGDLRPEHILLNNAVVAGVIDWGTARFDSPLVDVARLAGELSVERPDAFDRVLDGYEQAAGAPIARRAVRCLDESGAVLAAANWIRWLSDPGFDPRDPELVPQRLRSILARLPS